MNQEYTPAGFYLLRTPALSSQTYLDLITVDEHSSTISEQSLANILKEKRDRCYKNVQQLAAQPVVEQALKIASPSLTEGFKRIQREKISQHRIDHTYSKLLRYLVRMSTRATPFGLFSGVAIGSFSQQTDLQLATPPVQQMRTRPDMVWLLAIIEKIEQETNLLSQLEVVINHMVYLSGGRVIMPYADIYGKIDNRIITLRAVAPLRFVLEQARQPLPYQELRTRLRQKFVSATEQQIDTLLQQLWENHLLISNLRPPLTHANPACYLLEKLRPLRSQTPIVQALETVLAQTTEIDRAGVGASGELFQQLLHYQEILIPKKEIQPFQVDGGLKLEATSLNAEIGRAAAQATQTLFSLNRTSYQPSIQDYSKAFLERYGPAAEVPLLELLSPEDGLDAPAGYTHPIPDIRHQPSPSPNYQQLDNWLCSLAAEAINNHALEIELTESWLQKLHQARPQISKELPPSAEIFFQIQAPSRAAIDRGEWKLIIGSGVFSFAGSTFGRFFDILSQEDLTRLQTCFRQEEKLEPDILFAELSYLPPMARGANVAIRPLLRSYEIVVNTAATLSAKNTIALDDIVVGVKNEHLYLRSIRLGKEIIVRQTHMLNDQLAPNVCRFLLDVSRARYAMPSTFNWGNARYLPFLPRVVQNKVVLSPAQWHVSKSSITSNDNDSSNDEVSWFNDVQRWRKQWRIPRFVYLVNQDNRLLLDLEHPIFLNELQTELKKINDHEALQLQEMLPDFENLWLRDTQNAPYIAEFVVPLLLKPESIQNNVEPLARKIESAIQAKRVLHSRERYEGPGGQWTYLKLYAPTKKFTELISGPLRTIADQLQEQGSCDRWFYIRYADPLPHLRIRFHAAHADLKDQVHLKALAWSQELLDHGIISRISIDTYEREIERYGGPEAIDALEQIFCVDSNTVSKLITALDSKRLTLDQPLIAVASLDYLLTTWGLSFERRLHYIQQHTEKYQFASEFREHRKVLSELLAPWQLNDESLLQQRNILYTLLASQENVIRQVATHISVLASQRELWQSEEGILSSLCHMHINRFLGIDRNQENKVYAFWRHTLESIYKRPPVKRDPKRALLQ